MTSNMERMSRVTWQTHGDDGTRTRDFLLAKEALYQLSYIPSLGPGACAREVGL